MPLEESPAAPRSRRKRTRDAVLSLPHKRMFIYGWGTRKPLFDEAALLTRIQSLGKRVVIKYTAGPFATQRLRALLWESFYKGEGEQ